MRPAAPTALALGLVACTGFHPLALPEPGSVLARHAVRRVEAPLPDLQNPLLPPLVVDLRDGLGPAEAAALAAAFNPELVAARDERQAARAEVLAAGLLPNPVFGFEGLDPYGSQASGLDFARTFHLSLDTAQLVTRSARLAAAEAARDEVDLGIAWQEWQVGEGARLETVRLGWLRQRLALADADAGLLRDSVAALERARAAGDASLLDLGSERIAFETARRLQRELEDAEATSEAALAVRLGLSPAEHLEVEAPARVADPASLPPELEPALPLCLAHRLDLEALRRGYAAEEANLRAAVLEQLPTLSVGLTHEKNEDGIRFLGGFVDVSVPVFDRAQGKIAATEATRARLGHEYEARVLAVRSEVALLVAELQRRERQLAEVHGALPPLAELEAETQAAWERGDVSRAAYQAVRRNYLDLQLDLEALLQARAESWVGLALACGHEPVRS